MKTILSILLILSSFSALAQLQEVRGVETKRVDDGFSFYNRNSFPVSVETIKYGGNDEIDSKDFDLDAGETYVWRTSTEYLVLRGTYDRDLCHVKYRAYRKPEEPKNTSMAPTASNSSAHNTSLESVARFETKEIAATFPGGTPAFDAFLSSVVNNNSYGNGIHTAMGKSC